MADKKFTGQDKPEKLFLSPELTNYLFTALQAIEEIDSNSRTSQKAALRRDGLSC